MVLKDYQSSRLYQWYTGEPDLHSPTLNKPDLSHVPGHIAMKEWKMTGYWTNSYGIATFHHLRKAYPEILSLGDVILKIRTDKVTPKQMETLIASGGIIGELQYSIPSKGKLCTRCGRQHRTHPRTACLATGLQYAYMRKVHHYKHMEELDQTYRGRRRRRSRSTSRTNSLNVPES